MRERGVEDEGLLTEALPGEVLPGDVPPGDDFVEEGRDTVQEGEQEQISVEELAALMPPENQELLDAILEISSQPQGDRSRVYAALSAAKFLVPLAKEPPMAEQPAAGQEYTIDVVTLTGENGELALPVFTHDAALDAWADREYPTMELLGQAVFQLAAGSPMQFILVNPAGPFGGQVARAEFESLAQGMLPAPAPGVSPVSPAPQNVYFDAPLAPIPGETETRLREILEASAAVQGAYLFLMQVGEAGSPRLALGLEVEGAAGQWVLPQLKRTFEREDLDFQPYERPDILILENLPGVESIRETIPPVFQRGGFQARAVPPAEAVEEEPGIAADAELAGEEIEEPLDEGAPRRRRSLWPFRRQI